MVQLPKNTKEPVYLTTNLTQMVKNFNRRLNMTSVLEYEAIFLVLFTSKYNLNYSEFWQDFRQAVIFLAKDFGLILSLVKKYKAR